MPTLKKRCHNDSIVVSSISDYDRESQFPTKESPSDPLYFLKIE